MTIALLATGDEIVNGDTLNTNGHFIAKTLSSEGLSLGLHLTCGDREQEIVNSLQFLSQQHNIIIIIGGLGPTSDDRTRFALARLLNRPLIEFSEAINHIQSLLSRGNLNFNSGNRQQALFLAESTLMPNPNGTAMGCYCTLPIATDEKLFFLLPGPPRECLPMFNHYVLPVLQQTHHSEKCILKWRLFGIAESAAGELLDTALKDIACETGYRLDTPYIEFKVRCLPLYITQIKQIVEPLIAAHVIAPPEEKASERLRKMLNVLKERIVIIDDVTGGVLQTTVQCPDNYLNVVFHDDKNATFYFHLKGLEQFWNHQNAQKTSVSIEYCFNEKSGQESHELPYFSANVVYYAAEWLSYRIFEILKKNFGM